MTYRRWHQQKGCQKVCGDGVFCLFCSVFACLFIFTMKVEKECYDIRCLEAKDQKHPEKTGHPCHPKRQWHPCKKHWKIWKENFIGRKMVLNDLKCKIFSSHLEPHCILIVNSLFLQVTQMITANYILSWLSQQVLAAPTATYHPRLPIVSRGAALTA